MKVLIPLFSMMLILSISTPAQVGTHELYGFTCKGSAEQPGKVCLSLNTVTKPGAIALFLGNQYAIKVTTQATPCTVTGFELHHATLAGHPVWVRTWIYAADVLGAPGQLLASGIMVVKPLLAWYGTGFKPVTIPANTSFFLAYDSSYQAKLSPAPIAQIGTKAMGYRCTNNTWYPLSQVCWTYKVHGGRVAGSGRPLLVNTTLPKIGKDFVSEAHYIPSLPPYCFHLVGFNNSFWAGLSLPFDLTPLGAQDCHLGVAINLVNPTPISTLTQVGTAKLSIPNQAALQGGVFYHQFLIQDNQANSMGLTFSNCGIGKIGP